MAQKDVGSVVPVNQKLLQRGRPSDYHEFIFQWLCYELELLGAENELNPERRAAAKKLVTYIERLSSRHVGFGIKRATPAVRRQFGTGQLGDMLADIGMRGQTIAAAGR